jgi:hypothetical protein
MQDCVTRPSSYIVKHGTLSHQIHSNKGIALRVFQGDITYRPAVSQNLFAASCFTQQLLIGVF